MTEPLNPDYCVNCHKCGKAFELVWGEDNDVCSLCKQDVIDLEDQKRVTWEIITHQQAAEINNQINHEYERYKEIAEFYANPENWRRFPIEDGVDANGSPVQQYWWIGDGGEFARKSLE